MFTHLRVKKNHELTREATYHLILLIFPVSRGVDFTGPAKHRYY